MAQDVVVANFTADLDSLKKEIDQYIDKLQEVQKEEKKTGIEAKKATETVESAAKKRNDAIRKEQAELKQLLSARRLAYDPKIINGFNSKISETTKRINMLKGDTVQAGASIKSAFAGVGAGIVAAFSIQAVSQFAKASIDAFLEAEENANRLKFAVTQVGGEGEVAFNKLIKQSEKFQGFFSDDDIQRSQIALTQFGLTSDQVEKLIPKILDLAAANRIDLAQATDAAIRSFEGQTRGLLTLGVKFDDTGSRIGNYNALLEKTEKFSGALEDATNSLAGQLTKANNEADELQEQIGSFLTPSFIALRKAVLDAFAALVGFQNLEKNLDSDRVDLATKSVEQFVNTFKSIGANLDTGLERKIQSLLTEFDRLGVELASLREEATIFGIEFSAPEIDAIKRRQLLVGEQIKQFEIYRQAQRDAAKATNEVTEAVKVAKKASDERIAGSDKEIKQIETLLAQYKDLQAILTDKDKAQLIELSVLSETDFEAFRKKIIELVAENPIEIPVTLVVPDDRKPGDQVGNPDKPSGKNAADTFFKDNEEIISASTDLVNEVSSLYQTLAQNQINSINEATNAQLESLALLSEANKDNLDKRRISATEAAAVEKELQNQRVRTEQEADKKIREIKRKQAIADKAAALVSIAIDTAKNIVAAGNPFIAALYAALGAAQAAIVAAQPIPYEKGTKDAQGGLSRVDEAGKEVIYRKGRGRLTTLEKGDKVVPAPQSRKYEGFFDAIIDNKVDDYVTKNYIAPQLEKQKREFMETQEKSFAQNITRSIMIQQAAGGKGDFYLERMSKNGMAINNVEAFASAIASKLVTDPYRR